MSSTWKQLLTTIEEGDEYDRVEAAKALADVEDREVTGALAAVLRLSVDQDARKWAAYTLGFRGDERAKPVLIAALRDRTNSIDIRCHAAEALGHLLECRRGQREARAALREALTEKPADLRFWSAFALGNIGTRADIPPLQALAAGDYRVVPNWWSVSKEAADAIARIQSRRVPSAPTL